MSMFGRFRNAADYVQQKMRDIDKTFETALQNTGDMDDHDPLQTPHSTSPPSSPSTPSASSPTPVEPVQNSDVHNTAPVEPVETSPTIESLTQENAELKKTINKLSHYKELVSSSWTELEAIKSEFTRRLGSEQRTITQLRKKVNELQAEIAQKDEILTTAESSLESMVPKSDLRELERLYKELLEQEGHLQQKVSDLEKVNKDLVNESQDLTHRLAEMRSKRVKSEGQNSDNNSVIRGMVRSAMSKMESDLHSVQNQWETKLDRLKNRINDAQILVTKSISTVKSTQSNQSIKMIDTQDQSTQIDYARTPSISCHQSVQCSKVLFSTQVNTEFSIDQKFKSNSNFGSIELVLLKDRVAELTAENLELQRKVSETQAKFEPPDDLLLKYEITLDLLGQKSEELDLITTEYEENKKLYQQQIANLAELLVEKQEK
ncbi:hypothetical protein P9112_010290 [Eukaryota sp. TZLM1-RC]